MTEIEQMPGRSHVAGAISSIVYDKRAELAKLEAEAAAKADRWAGAKKTLDVFEYHLKHGGENAIVHADVLHYARHLEHRVAELEKQLAKRPVVWQLRDRKSGEVRLVGDFGRKYAAIYSDAEIEYLKTLNGWVAFTNDFAIEPYTGEQP